MTDLNTAVYRLLNEIHDLRLEGGNPSLRAAVSDVVDAMDTLVKAPEAPSLEPVPSSECPWDRPGWCDGNGYCWLGGVQLNGADLVWIYGPVDWAKRFPYVHQFLLPFNAIPLPKSDG